MLSLIELERVAGVLSQELVGARVQRWLEPERGVLSFSLHDRAGGVSKKIYLQIDARPDSAHIGSIARLPAAPPRMPALTAYLRAHLGRARLEEVSLRGGDRQLVCTFSAKEGCYDLMLSVFGRRSNLYLLNEEGTLLQALRPLAETRSELAIGSVYASPGSSAPGPGQDRFPGESGWALLETISKHYAVRSEESDQVSLQKQILTALRKEKKTTVRRISRLEGELAEAEKAGELATQGELLKANLGRIEPGAATVQVENWEGGLVEIALDPKRSAKANMEAIFKRYQKLLRRLTKAGGQIDSARESLATLEELENQALALESAEAAEALAQHPQIKTIISHQASKSQGSANEKIKKTVNVPSAYRHLPRKLHPRRYLSQDGLEIWVGRSDEGNDVLTTRLARGNDLFFHLDGAPGSHVILRTGGQADPPPESVIDACELSVHFSKQKKAGSADVHVSPIKNVKKPKGAKRGLVYVTGGRSVHLRREAERLERLLGSRIEE